MNKFTLWGLLLLLAGGLPAQSPGGPSINEAYQQLGAVMEHDLNNHKHELRNESETVRLKLQAEVNEKLQEIRAERSRLEYLIYIMGGLTAIGWISTWWGTNNFIRGQLRQMVRDRVHNQYPELVRHELKGIIQKGSAELNEVIRKQSLEWQIRAESFSVICADKADEKEARQLLQTLGFSQPQFCLLDEYDGVPQDQLVVYYDMKQKMLGKKDNVLIRQLADARQRADGTIFVFAIPGYWSDLNNYKDLANAANSPYTLYARLVESLSFLYLKNNRS